MLKSFYESVNGGGANFQIVFVSSDKSEGEAREYFKNDHGDWLLLDFSQKDGLGEKYGVKGIPSLVVIDSAGNSIAPDARDQVGSTAEKGDAAAMKAVVAEWAKHCGDWRETAGESLGGAYVAGSPEAMRAARLARLGGGPPPPVQQAPAPSPAPVAQAAPAAQAPTLPAAQTAPAPAVPPAADATAMAQLTSMGFDAGKAKQALEATNGDVDAAAAVLLGGAGDAMDVDDAVPRGGAVNPEAVAQLTAMGFGAAQVEQALEAAGGNVEAASAILLGD